jgi:hypothetical protein
MIYKFFPQDVIRLYAASPVYMIVDSVVYYGILVISLVLFLFIVCIQKRIKLDEIYFLIFLFFFSSILSLGTTTPFSLILNNILRKVLPFFELFAAPSRHSFLAILSLNLIFCYLSYIFLKKSKNKSYKIYIVFTIVLFCTFLIEYFPVNYNYYYKIDPPSILYEISSSLQEFTVLNIPHNVNTQAMYLQTLYQKKI